MALELDAEVAGPGPLVARVRRGMIDAAAFGSLDVLFETADHMGGHRLALGLGGLEGLDEAGLGALVERARSLRRSGGGLCLFDVALRVRNALDLVGATAFFGVAKDVDGAKNHLSGAPAQAAVVTRPDPQMEHAAGDLLRLAFGQKPVTKLGAGMHMLGLEAFLELGADAGERGR